MSPDELLKAVRNQWAIENSLHWALDVQMGEDDLRNRAGHGAESLAAVRRIALNIICLMDDKLSIRRRLRWAAQKPENRLEFICRAAELAPELSNAIALKWRSADRPQKNHDRPQRVHPIFFGLRRCNKSKAGRRSARLQTSLHRLALAWLRQLETSDNLPIST